MTEDIQRTLGVTELLNEKIASGTRLSKNKVRVPRRDNYEKRPVLSATIHPDIKKTLVSMSERTGLDLEIPKRFDI